ncbi:MAG: arginine-tRNA-protein transferase [Bacteroidota bacterium]
MLKSKQALVEKYFRKYDFLTDIYAPTERFMGYRYVEKVHPFTLSPKSLDWYLSKGWYRMGSNIFTTHFLCFQQQLYSAIWIRIDLADFSFSKSQRKLMARNAKKFTATTAFRRFTQEKEILYSRYSSNFNGRLSPSLRDSLEDYDEFGVFTTFETNIREITSKELVAASYFDIGEQAAASILGIYEPAYEKHSLGYYTMLLEMKYCMENGIRYYYPGYVVPGYQRFDYKLRLGPAQFYDLRIDSWIDYEQFNMANGPVERQARQLNRLKDQLDQRGLASELSIYPLFEARLYHLWQAEYLNYPYLLLLNGRPTASREWLIAAYDPHTSNFRLLTAQSLEELRYLFSESYLQSFPEAGYVRCLLQQNQQLFQTAEVAEMATIIINLIR